MNVTVENLSSCKKLLRIEIDVEAVNKAFEEMTREFASRVSLPGFRPGKAPRAMVEKQYGKAIEDEVKKKLIPDGYKHALQSEKLNVVGYPDIEEIQFGRGQSVQFAATVEIEPDFSLPEYVGLPVKLPSKSVTQADVDRALQLLRERKAEITTAARAAQEGDVVVVNYVGTCEGKPITEFAPAARGLTEQKNFWVDLNPTAFIPGFGPKLVGAFAGDKLTVEVEFPADFVTPQVAGKKGSYEVEVVEVKEKKLPALDDAFAQGYGAENLDKLREGVWRDLENELEYKKKNEIRRQLTEALLGSVQCDLPEAVVLQETRKVVYNIVNENRRRGIAPEAIDEKKDDIFASANASAKDRVKLGFIFRRIATKENIKAEQQEVVERVHRLAAAYETTVDRFVKQLEKGAGIAEIYDQILNEKVLDLITKNAKVEETPAEAPAATT